jgi:hypothetical protein
MAYVELTDLHGKIPPQFLIQALDDDADGAIDAGIWELVQSQAGQSVDSRLGQRYAVPLAADAPGIAVAREAALIFALEGVYARRLPPDQNPWMGMGNAQRAKLDRIGAGDEPLTPTTNRVKPSGSVIASPARTDSERLAL